MNPNVYEIAALIVAVSVSALAISAIPAVIQIKRTFKAIEELSIETKGLIETLNNILRKVDNMVGDFEETTARIKQAGERIGEVIELVSENIKKPILAIGTMLCSIENVFRLIFKKDQAKGGVKNDD